MYMQLLQRKFILSAAVMAAAAVGLADRAPAALVAQWTFNSGNNSGLTSEVGGYKLTETGTGSIQTTTYNNDGTVSLGAGRLLVASAINSTNLPSLKNGMTIWVRFKIDGTPSGNAPIFGLINATSSLTGNYIDLNGTATREKYVKTSASWLSDGGAAPTVKFSGITSSGVIIGPGSNTNKVTLGTYITAAITVSDTGTLTYADRTNGNTVSRSAGNTDLMDFQSFAIGRLWADAANAVTVDEIRIYDSALSDTQIDAIAVAPIPETASLSLLAIGGAALLRRKR